VSKLSKQIKVRVVTFYSHVYLLSMGNRVRRINYHCYGKVVSGGILHVKGKFYQQHFQLSRRVSIAILLFVLHCLLLSGSVLLSQYCADTCLNLHFRIMLTT